MISEELHWQEKNQPGLGFIGPRSIFWVPTVSGPAPNMFPASRFDGFYPEFAELGAQFILSFSFDSLVFDSLVAFLFEHYDWVICSLAQTSYGKGGFLS